MKNIILLSLIGLSCCLPRKEPRCSRFRTGIFIINGEGQQGITRVKRSNDFQIEQDYNTNSRTKFKVEWLDSCTYKLKFISSNHDFAKPYRDVTVHIVATKEDSYFIEATVEGNNSFVYRSEMFKEH
jgi:hypothetical protein